MDPFIGEIRIFAGNFAPQGWAFCDGSILSIAQFDALFALIGTTYGGDGQSTFQLPDLRGRVPLHQGTGYVIGQVAGTESVTLTVQQLPQHTHPAQAATLANSVTPSGKLWSTDPNGNIAAWATTPTANTPLAGNAVGNAGQNLPHDNMQPYLAVSYIISLFGIFPSQN